MKKLLFLLVPAILFAQSVIRVKVASYKELERLLTSGYDVIHYDRKTQEVLIYTRNPDKLKLNFSYVIRDTKKWWDKSPYKINFGPYYTYNEAVAEMDKLHNLYPSIVGEKFSIGTTYEGRTIWAFEVTYFDGSEDTRPSVLYEAAIHAREPGGVSTLFGFVWHLVRNYGNDPEVTELLNSRRLYFIPIVNPDGYVYNESSDGYWRKNKRDNDNDGIFEESDDGVDLNRNFSYEWGYDDNGSSPDPTTNTYRGPYPFSEPETQAVKFLTDSIQPKVAIDYHTYSNLLMFPWGYANVPTSDDALLRTFAQKLTETNGYAIGRPGELLYNANGVTIDWWYSDSTHPKILAYTAEVGEAFWQPDTAVILEQINENIPMNMLLAKMAGAWIDIESADGDSLYEETHAIRLENVSAVSVFNNGNITIIEDSLKRYGITSVSPQAFTIPSLGIIPDKNDTVLNFNLLLPDSFIPGWIKMYFSISSPNYSSTKSATFIVGNIVPEFFCDFENGYAEFLTNHWDTTSSTYHSPYHSITDSKGGNYSNYDTSYLELKDTFDLTDTTAMYYISFYTKYSLEQGYDYAYFQVREINESTWNTLKTFNDTADWHRVIINLEKFRGKRLKFRFYMTTDQSVTYDGIYVDDITFKKIPEFYSPSGVKERISDKGSIGGINRIIYNSPLEHSAHITIFDVDGRMVKKYSVILHKGTNTLSFGHLKAGKYVVFIDNKQYSLLIGK